MNHFRSSVTVDNLEKITSEADGGWPTYTISLHHSEDDQPTEINFEIPQHWPPYTNRFKSTAKVANPHQITAEVPRE